MELKKLAEEIYQAELVIENSSKRSEIKKAKEKIALLSEQITSLEDFMIIDDYIMKKLEK